MRAPPLQGGYKLKIPTLLLNEKEKTRNRFGQVGFGSATLAHDTYAPAIFLTSVCHAEAADEKKRGLY